MDKTLQHYGVLGMKWGVRRTKAQLRRARGPNSPRKVTKEQYEAEKLKAIRSGDKNTVELWKSRLTNQELQEAINRIDMTKKMSSISSDQIQSGQSRTKNALANAAAVSKLVAGAPAAYEGFRQVYNTLRPHSWRRLRKIVP